MDKTVKKEEYGQKNGQKHLEKYLYMAKVEAIQAMLAPIAQQCFKCYGKEETLEAWTWVLDVLKNASHNSFSEEI